MGIKINNYTVKCNQCNTINNITSDGKETVKCKKCGKVLVNVKK
jgi:ribosomal protein S27E